MYTNLTFQFRTKTPQPAINAATVFLLNNRIIVFALCLLMCTSVIVSTQVAAQSINQNDSTTLVRLYEEYDGEQWHNSSGWLDRPVSEWYGIELEEINDQLRVIAIELENNKLSGDAHFWLAVELPQLELLRTLNLSGNRLTSTYDYEFEILMGVIESYNLESLKVSGNKGLKGTIHPDLMGHPNLEVLWFDETGLHEVYYNEDFQQWMKSHENLKRSGLFEGSPADPDLTQPADQADEIPLPVTLRWEEITLHPHLSYLGPADSFRVQLAEDENFEQILVDTLVKGTSVAPGISLNYEQSYYWRVQARNEVSHGIWTYGSQFTTMKEVEMTVTENSFSGPVFSGFSMIGEDFLMIPVSGDALYSLDASLQERFSLSVDGDLLSASSIAYDSSFYIGSTNNTLYAFNKNGAPLWNAAVGGEISATPAVDSITSAVYIGVENRNVIALDRQSGSTLWSFFASSPVRHSPVVSANRIMLIAASDGTIYGLDLESDEEPPHLWEYDLGENITANLSLGLPGYAYAVTAANALVSLQFDRQGIVEQWTADFEGDLSASPVIDAYNHLYVVDEGGLITKLDAETGDELWAVNLPNPVSTTPALGDGRLYVTDQSGIVYSIDPQQVSVNWQFAFAENPSRSMLYANGSLYIGSESGQVIRVYDPVDEIAGSHVTLEAAAESPLWGTDMGNNRRSGVQSDDKLITSIDDPDRPGLPVKFELAQNYPNPFNPATQVRYSLPEQAHVRLEVYNALGQRVATLVNETKKPGNYEATFEANGLSSGIYLYRLQTESHTQSKQMLLVK